MIRSILLAAAVLAAVPAAAQPGGLTGAVLAGDVAAVRTLIASGADVAERGDMGTPLHVAAFMGNAEIARLLLDAGRRSRPARTCLAPRRCM
jgi:ankyrin repeat protein